MDAVLTTTAGADVANLWGYAPTELPAFGDQLFDALHLLGWGFGDLVDHLEHIVRADRTALRDCFVIASKVLPKALKLRSGTN
jgi:hypothetical protein